MATALRGAEMPLNVALPVIPSLPRPLLARLVTRAIERLDEIDGDPDFEEDSEDCGQDEGEPDFRKRRRYRRGYAGPGCLISDSDFGAEEAGEREEYQ